MVADPYSHFILYFYHLDDRNCCHLVCCRMSLICRPFNGCCMMVYFDNQSGAIAGICAGGIMFMSFLLARLIYGSRQMERTIAFENPTGGVTVSLTALEDLIKRLIVQMPEVKEIRPYMIANRKGLEVDIKLVLRHEVNIPELTARFQDLVRRKIEEAVGMEGKINVRVHVIKISLEDIKSKNKDEFQIPTQAPFHGYRS